MRSVQTGPADELAGDVAAFIHSDGFPCVGAKSALALGTLEMAESGRFDQPPDYRAIRQRLKAFGDLFEASDAGDPLRAFLWGFTPGPVLSEEDFERHLWRHLQALHDLDASQACPWALDVSDDPRSPEFSMSLAGHPYFVVGLHPGASRAARRFERPLLAFNSHRQFAHLREDGRYGAMTEIIRARDAEAHGSINPMLGAHGVALQAPQYSGRQVPPDWRCPLRVRRPE